MANINAKGRSKKEPRHVRLYETFMRTDAWQSLDTVARQAYVELARRYGGPGSNNGRIPYSVREMAAALNVSKATGWRALRRLQEVGFAVETKRGTFKVKNKEATEWRLTAFDCDVTGERATKEFLRWKKQNTVPLVKPDGTSHETVRSLSRNRGNQKEAKTPHYGASHETVNTRDGFTRGTLLVNHPPSAVTDTAPSPPDHAHPEGNDSMKPTATTDGGAAESNSEPTRIEWLNGRRVDEMSCSAALHLPKFVRYPEASKRATELRASMQPIEPEDGPRVIHAIEWQLAEEGYRRADGQIFEASEIPSLFYTNTKADALDDAGTLAAADD